MGVSEGGRKSKAFQKWERTSSDPGTVKAKKEVPSFLLRKAAGGKMAVGYPSTALKRDKRKGWSIDEKGGKGGSTKRRA